MNTTTKVLSGVVIAAVVVYVVNEGVQWSDVSSTPEDSRTFTTDSGENSVINGDFDMGVDSWQLSEGWPVAWSSAEGNGSIRVTAISESGSTGKGVFSQCIGFSGNQIFELGGSFKKDNRSTQGGGGRIRVSWYEQPDCTGRAKTDTKSTSPKDGFGWQQLRVGLLAAPPEAQSVRMSIIQTVDGSGEFIAYWDNLYLKATR